jgi:hypothetical protein
MARMIARRIHLTGRRRGPTSRPVSADQVSADQVLADQAFAARLPEGAAR